MHDEQFQRERKMEQVIEYGATDAMKEIQEGLKQMIVLNKRKKQLDAQIEFQAKTEADLDYHSLEIKQKLSALEDKARQLGLNPEKLEEPDLISLHLKDPKIVELKKKKIEKNALMAIHKKFYGKIKDQKEILEQKLAQHNDFLVNHGPSSPQKGAKIDIQNHEIVRQMDGVLAELKGALPTISKKLPWQTMESFKPRSTSSQSRYPYKQPKRIVYSRNMGSKSVNDLSSKSGQSKSQNRNGRNLQIGTKQASTIEVLKSHEMGHSRPLLSQNRTPFGKPQKVIH